MLLPGLAKQSPDPKVFEALDLQDPTRSHHTVDGKHPAPVDMENIPVFVGSYTFQLVQDSFRQQYQILFFTILFIRASSLGSP